MKKLILSGSKLLLGFTILLTIMNVSDGCKKTSLGNYTSTPTPPGSGGPGANAVFIQGTAFSPATITVAAGTTITWTNKDSFNHTVTSNSPLFDSGAMGNGGTFSYTFTAAGTYPYHCSLHLSMTGTVIVN
jgi:plastocyanin